MNRIGSSQDEQQWQITHLTSTSQELALTLNRPLHMFNLTQVECKAKAISRGTVKEGRRQGRQKKRWEDNSRKWTDLEFAKSERAVENKDKRRKLVVKSSVVSHQPSRLGG